MRNLKKVLSLALALVMLVGMMVVGAGAATYADSASVQKGEAVDVMSGIGVFTGNDAGNFNPAGYLNRQEAAKILATVTLGPVVANNLSVANTGFDDVPSSSWASGFIAYCANENIIVGSDGKFRPYDLLEATDFAKMLLVAVGKDASRYVGNGWNLNVQRDALDTGLLTNVTMGAWFDPITRENAAQMALNAINYSPSGATTEFVVKNASGTVVYQGTDAMQAALVDSIINSGTSRLTTETKSPDSLAWSVFKLTSKSTTDSFGRATKTWQSNGKDVAVIDGGSAAKTYTTKVAAATAAADLNGLAFATTTELWSNGAKTTPYTASTNVGTTINGLTENGKVVEVYAANGTINKVVAVEYTVGQLTVTPNPTTGDVTYGVNQIGSTAIGGLTGVDYAAANATDTVAFHGAVAKDDIVTVVKDATTLHVYPTTKVEGIQTAYSNSAKTITVNGASYVVADGVRTDGATGKVAIPTTLNGVAANFFIDQNGFMVATTAITQAASTNYAQVKGTAVTTVATTVDGDTPSVQARFVLSDGTVNVYGVKLTKAANGDWTLCGSVVYDADAAHAQSDVKSAVDAILADGTVFGYTLDGTTISLEAKTAVSAADLTAKSVYTGAVNSTNYTGETSASLGNSKVALMTSNTVFVLYNALTNTATTVVGAANLPKGASLAHTTTKVVMTAANTTTGTADVVFGVYTPTAVTSGNYVYIDHTKYDVVYNATTKATVRQYNGLAADGSTVVVFGTNDGGDSTNLIDATGVYNYNTDNTVSKTTKVAAATGDPISGMKSGTVSVVGNLMAIGDTNYYDATNAKTVFVNPAVTTVNGSTCTVILNKGVVETVYVTAAPVVKVNAASSIGSVSGAVALAGTGNSSSVAEKTATVQITLADTTVTKSEISISNASKVKVEAADINIAGTTVTITIHAADDQTAAASDGAFDVTVAAKDTANYKDVTFNVTGISIEAQPNS